MNEDFFSFEPSNDDNDYEDLEYPFKDTDLQEFNNVINIEAIVPENFCRFCSKQFQQPGSFGRHLDSKKGDKLHPTAEVEKIRKNVVRRKVEVRAKDIQQMKQKKKLASMKYNSQEDVKEKNKMRRKSRDRQIKARLMANTRFLEKLGQPRAETDINFAKYCALYLPVSKWPENEPLNAAHLEYIQQNSGTNCLLTPAVLGQINESFERWACFSEDMQEHSWASEKRQALVNALGDATLSEIQHHQKVLSTYENNILDELNEDNDNLL